MITGIDHLVIAVKDLEAATRAYGELGFTVVPGGRHPVGTYNTLIAFADGSYLELIGFYRDNPDHRWWAALQRGGGLVDYCLQTDDLMGDTRAFRDAGVDIADPVSQSRLRPDGTSSAGCSRSRAGRIAAWDPSSSMTRRRARSGCPAADAPQRRYRHRRGAHRPDDLATVSRGTPRPRGQSGPRSRSPETGSAGTRFMAGPHAIEFLAPRPDGTVAQWLGQRGASPLDATLYALFGRFGPLDPAPHRRRPPCAPPAT